MRVPDFAFECFDHNYVMYEYDQGWWTYTTLECANEDCSWVGFVQRAFRWRFF
jgi:hypothetical protein